MHPKQTSRNTWLEPTCSFCSNLSAKTNRCRHWLWFLWLQWLYIAPHQEVSLLSPYPIIHQSGTRNVQTPSTKLSRHKAQPLKPFTKNQLHNSTAWKTPTKTTGRPTTYKNNLQKVAWKVLHSSTFPSPSHPPPPNTASARGRGHVSDAPSRPENIHGAGYRWCLAWLANMIFGLEKMSKMSWNWSI